MKLITLYATTQCYTLLNKSNTTFRLYASHLYRYFKFISGSVQILIKILFVFVELNCVRSVCLVEPGSAAVLNKGKMYTIYRFRYISNQMFDLWNLIIIIY